MDIFRITHTIKPAARSLALLASAALLVSAGSLGATETIVEHIEEPAPLEEPRPRPTPQATGAVKPARTPLETGTEIERFCSNIADAARDRRYVLQTEELQALQQEVDKRIKLLEEKRAEYEAWLKRREDFLAKAEDGVVKIYSGMRPDAAAERLAEMDADLAAGILMKLDARKAGVILNEMERKAAAMLTGVMASGVAEKRPDMIRARFSPRSSSSLRRFSPAAARPARDRRRAGAVAGRRGPRPAHRRRPSNMPAIRRRRRSASRSGTTARAGSSPIRARCRRATS